jgi:PKHD-type hydroxylase
MHVGFIFPPAINDPQNYYYFQHGFSKPELNQIYKDVETLPFQEATTIGGGNANKDIRSSSVKWIPQNEDWMWLYRKMGELATTANNALWRFNLTSMPELIQYTEYYASEDGHYDWHQDIGPSTASLRKVSITVQLSESDEYEGGDLEITQGSGSMAMPRGAGVTIIFPSYMLHRVTKVTKGTRRSFVLWVGGEHFK